MDSPQTDLEALKLAAEARKLEIDNLWKRSLFFWGFIMAAALGYCAVHKSNKGLQFPLTVLARLGFLYSECWVLINIGSKFWHRAWEKKIEKLGPNEQVFFRYPLNEEKFPWEIRFSPSKIIILLSLITWAGWFVLIIWNYHQFGCCRWWWVLVSVVTTVLAVLLPWLSTRHEEPKASSA